MSFFRDIMNAKFASCRLLAVTHDNCRDREVRLYLLPGHFEEIGVFDGVDSWIAPVRADVFNVNVLRLIDELRRTGRVEVHRDAKPRPRKKLLEPDAAAGTRRRAVPAIAEFLTAPQILPTKRTRRALIS